MWRIKFSCHSGRIIPHFFENTANLASKYPFKTINPLNLDVSKKEGFVRQLNDGVSKPFVFPHQPLHEGTRQEAGHPPRWDIRGSSPRIYTVYLAKLWQRLP
jgi:hypothetical protein